MLLIWIRCEQIKKKFVLIKSSVLIFYFSFDKAEQRQREETERRKLEEEEQRKLQVFFTRGKTIESFVFVSFQRSLLHFVIN